MTKNKKNATTTKNSNRVDERPRGAKSESHETLPIKTKYGRSTIQISGGCYVDKELTGINNFTYVIRVPKYGREVRLKESTARNAISALNTLLSHDVEGGCDFGKVINMQEYRHIKSTVRNILSEAFLAHK